MSYTHPLIYALDNQTPTQIGENGTIEYTWSNLIQEKIVQFHFQLVRTDEKNMKSLENVLRSILHFVSNVYQNNQTDMQNIHHISLLYRMIGYTRDIIDGKGEYALTYMMIYVWYDFFPELAKFALDCLIYTDEEHPHPYGSWKDIKKACQYFFDRQPDHPLIDHAIHLMNTQLKKDYELFQENTPLTKKSLSLVAKWVPREKSRYKWLFHLLACNYFVHYLKSSKNIQTLEKAKLKCYMDYRKIITELNRTLDTLQIKQCANHWSAINFNNVTSISFAKQNNAFLNIKNGLPRHPENEDRQTCATNFSSFIKENIKEGKEIKGKRLGMDNFTKQAIALLDDTQFATNEEHQLKVDVLNSQWRDNSLQTKCLEKMIAMVDVSGSMDGDPLHVAIALGIRVSEKSVLGNRVMTFHATPSWINLDKCDGFVSKVSTIRNADWGMNTNFYSAMRLILDAIIENKMDPDVVKDIVLAIFSDMQIDEAEGDDNNAATKTMYDEITCMYAEAGMRVHGKPYKPPHILFWNLRSTSGFPTMSSQQNVSMMSGYSPSLLNLFCEQGIEALQTVTPWSQLERSLENSRYERMKIKSNAYFTPF